MEIRQNWFGGGAPTNWKPAITTIGAGASGTINIIVDSIDAAEADGYTVEVEINSDVSEDLAVSLTGKALVVTLGTDGTGAADNTLNTAELIVEEINELTGLTATFTGDGSTPLDTVEDEKDFTAMQYGTECPEPMVVVRVWDAGSSEWDYYVNIAPNGKFDTNWRIFNLVEY